MTVCSREWETMDQIKTRLGIRAEKAIERVKLEHYAGKNVCRFVTVQG